MSKPVVPDVPLAKGGIQQQGNLIPPSIPIGTLKTLIPEIKLPPLPKPALQ